MTPCFIDTFYFVALFSADDEAHERAANFGLRSKRPLLTTTWVLVKLCDGLCGTPARGLIPNFIQNMRRDTSIKIVEASEDFFDRGFALYSARRDKQWSLTDCISFIVMQDHNITDVLTGDRHFEQAGFNAILK